MATRLPNGKEQFLNPTTGEPLVGGFVWHYVPATSNLKDTYKDIAGTVLNTNPIVLDANGSAVIWGNGTYRQLLLDAAGNTIWDQDTSSGISSVMDAVTGAATLSLAMQSLGISLPWQPVVGAASLSTGMTTMGISPAMQPVVGAATLALARTALGVDAVGLEVYNVKAYGATGDGVTDDLTAINLAIAACVSGIVYFPPGIYMVTSTLFIPPGVAFWGTTRLSSTIIAGANNVNLVGFVASALTTGFAITNLGFSSGGFSGCAGILLDGVDSSKRLSIINLTNLYFSTLNVGIYLSYGANITMYNCFANVCTTGFWLNNCADVSLVALQAQNGPGFGFYIIGSSPGAFDEGVKLVNCSTNGQVYGFSVQDQDWGMMSNCSFTTCTGQPGSFLNCENWRVSTTDIAAAAPVIGLTVDSNSVNIQISECFFALNTFGVSLEGTRMSVKGCHFVGNSNVDIYVQSTANVIANNICDSVGVGISVQEFGAANFSAMTGNTTNGTVNLIGGGSIATGNVVY